LTRQIPPAISAAFSALAFASCIPILVIIFNWLATLRGGSIALNTPMLCALVAIVHLTIGSLAGLFLANPATAVYLHGTMFSVAQLHYVLVGVVLMAMLGGLCHWWPKISGRIYRETYARLGTVIIFVGMNITFFP